VLPATRVKNRQARVVVVNDVAQSVLEEVRGEHPVYVFTWEDREEQRDRVGDFRNSGWIHARRRAAVRYTSELGREAPAGFRNVRVHDLRHTFGWRLRTVRTSWGTGPPGSRRTTARRSSAACWTPPTVCKSPAKVPQ
jgi:integrase